MSIRENLSALIWHIARQMNNLQLFIRIFSFTNICLFVNIQRPHDRTVGILAWMYTMTWHPKNAIAKQHRKEMSMPCGSSDTVDKCTAKWIPNVSNTMLNLGSTEDGPAVPCKAIWYMTRPGAMVLCISGVWKIKYLSNVHVYSFVHHDSNLITNSNYTIYKLF